MLHQDPAFPGSAFKPEVHTLSWRPDQTLAGQTLTSPRAYMDLNLQYVHRNMTYGVYVTNVFDDYRSEPGVNQDWQPVATGVGGAQTGQYAGMFIPSSPKRKTRNRIRSIRPAAATRSGFNQYLAPVPANVTCRGRTVRGYIEFAFRPRSRRRK